MAFLPDERSVTGRIEITRHLKNMREKIMSAKPTLRTLPEKPKSSRRPRSAGGNTTRTPTRSRPQSAKSSSPRTTFSSPPHTFELAERLSANRKKARAVDYAQITHHKTLRKMYTKIQNMRSDLSDLDSGSSTPRKKKTKTNRISIDWESGHVYSAPASPFSTKKKPKRPQSAPPRQRIKATTSKPECRAYKEAIKDYICENSIYEEERLHELFESYKREKQKENEDVVIRAIEELKIELNVV